jgi:hypothetical protein
MMMKMRQLRNRRMLILKTKVKASFLLKHTLVNTRKILSTSLLMISSWVTRDIKDTKLYSKEQQEVEKKELERLIA